MYLQCMQQEATNISYLDHNVLISIQGSNHLRQFHCVLERTEFFLSKERTESKKERSFTTNLKHLYAIYMLQKIELANETEQRVP